MKSVRENLIEIKNLAVIDCDLFGDSRRQSLTSVLQVIRMLTST